MSNNQFASSLLSPLSRQEKDRLEEQIMQKEKAILDMAENVDQLKSTVTQMTAEAAHKEHEFKVKVGALLYHKHSESSSTRSRGCCLYH